MCARLCVQYLFLEGPVLEPSRNGGGLLSFADTTLACIEPLPPPPPPFWLPVAVEARLLPLLLRARDRERDRARRDLAFEGPVGCASQGARAR